MEEEPKSDGIKGSTRRSFAKGLVAATSFFFVPSRAKAQSVPTSTNPAIEITPPPRRFDSTSPESELLPTPEQLSIFQDWADSHGIILKSTSQPVFAWTSPNYDPDIGDVPLSEIKGAFTIYQGLSKLPDEILEVIRGNIIYMTSTPGRSTYVEAYPLRGLKDGLYMAAGTTYAQSSVHEFGHLFDSLAIGATDGVNDRPMNFPKFHALLDEYYTLFPSNERLGFNTNFDTAERSLPGFISGYASANRAENFAEHFAYYVMEGEVFRAKMQSDPLLTSKYNFLKEKIFSNQEY